MTRTKRWLIVLIAFFALALCLYRSRERLERVVIATSISCAHLYSTAAEPWRIQVAPAL